MTTEPFRRRKALWGLARRASHKKKAPSLWRGEREARHSVHLRKGPAVGEHSSGRIIAQGRLPRQPDREGGWEGGRQEVGWSRWWGTRSRRWRTTSVGSSVTSIIPTSPGEIFPVAFMVPRSQSRSPPQ
jgi:hypothetical protein